MTRYGPASRSLQSLRRFTQSRRTAAHNDSQILVEIDEDSDWTAEAQMVERIVCEAMQELNGTIPISCSIALSRFWSKSAAAVYDDKGRLTMWKA